MITTYNTIRNDVQGLIKELKTYPYNKDFYMKIRAWDREPDFNERSDIQKSARFIYLNRTGFNGLYRENSQ
jgi:DNA adenine methylase